MSYTDQRKNEWLEDAISEHRFRLAEKRMTKAWLRATGGLGEIYTLREVTMQRPYGWEQAYIHTKINEFRGFATDPANAQMWVHPVTSDRIDELAATMAQSALRKADFLIDSASIVFAHSIIEEALVAFLECGALAMPEVWAGDLSAKRISFDEIRLKSLDRLHLEVLVEHLQQLERKSLRDKAKIFMARFPPPDSNQSLSLDYCYDELQLDQLDARRTAIIHGEGLTERVVDWNSESYYWSMTLLYWVSCLNNTAHLRIDPSAVGVSGS